MRQPEDLTQLIQSLTKSEKRYFKLYAKRHARSKTTKYVDLFDALVTKPSSKAGTKAELSAAADAFPSDLKHIKNLPSARHYLHGLVMSSLRAFHAGKTPEKRIREGIEDAELLFSRGLLDQAERLLKQLFTPAEQREDFLLMLQIVQRRREMITTRADITTDTAALFSHERQIMRQLMNVRQYQELSAKVFRLIREFGHASNNSTAAAMQALKQNSLLTDASQAQSLTAELFRSSTLAGIAYFENDSQLLFDYCRQHTQVCKTFHESGGLPADKYADSMHNYLHACLDLGRFDEMVAGLEELKALNLADELSQVRSLVTQYSLWCVVMLARGSDADLRKYINEFDANYARMQATINPEQLRVISLRTAMLLFKLRDYSAALDRLTPIIHGPRDSPRHDISHSAELLRLLLHYMLGDWAFLENAITSLRRRVDLASRPISQLLVQTMEALLRAAPPEHRNITEQALRQLEELTGIDNQAEHTILESGILREWFHQLLNA